MRETEKRKSSKETLAMEGEASDVEREEDNTVIKLLRDRFRLSTISIAKAEEQLAKDLELFAQYADHKSVNMEDVILSAHRKKRLATTLRSFCNDLKGKNPNLRGNGRSYQ